MQICVYLWHACLPRIATLCLKNHCNKHFLELVCSAVFGNISRVIFLFTSLRTSPVAHSQNLQKINRPIFLQFRPHASSMTKYQASSVTIKHLLQNNSIGATPVAESTPASADFGSNVQTPGESLYLPSKFSLNSLRHNDSTPLTKLNEFLDSRDVSLVRHTVTVPWDEAMNTSSPSSQGTTSSRCCLGGSFTQTIRKVVVFSCSIFESTILQ